MTKRSRLKNKYPKPESGWGYPQPESSWGYPQLGR